MLLIEKRFQIKLLCGLLLGCLAQSIHANPQVPVVTRGQASFSQNGHTLTVTNTPNTIINWKEFSIDAHETTRFVQQSANSAVLNRVNGNSPSEILGKLQSNGRVFLVNPRGVVFGAGASVDVNALMATTLDIKDQDFLQGKLKFSGENDTAVRNAGSITTPSGGKVYLIAANVENTGLIQAPNGEIWLAAGRSVELVDTANPALKFNISAPAGEASNVGKLIAESGQLGMLGALVKNRGTISADSVVQQGGKILLKASQRAETAGVISANGLQGGQVQMIAPQAGVMAGAQILANGTQQGGNIEVLSNQAAYVAADAQLQANAYDQGSGGNIKIWSDDTARIYGQFAARGGRNGGDGGLVETSAGWLDVAGVRVDTLAPAGKAGTWLLDPWDLVVSNLPSTALMSLGIWSSGSGASNVLNTDINAMLNAGNNVKLQTSGVDGDGNGSGNIVINAPISKTSGTDASLDLLAHNSVFVTQPISATVGKLNVNIYADNDMKNGGGVQLLKPILSNNGNVYISASNDIQLHDGTQHSISAGMGSVSLMSMSGSIDGDLLGGAFGVQANMVSLTSQTGIRAQGGSMPLYLNAATISFSNLGSNDVSILNTYAAGPDSFTGNNVGGRVFLGAQNALYGSSVNNVNAAQDVYLYMDKMQLSGAVKGSTVFINPFSSTTMSVGGTDLLNLQATDLGNITASRIVLGTDHMGKLSNAVNVATSTAVNLATPTTLEIWGAGINVGNMGFANNGQTTLRSDALQVTGMLKSSVLEMASQSITQQIHLGAPDSSGILGIDAAELANIQAATVRIGNPGNAGVNVMSPVNLSQITTLKLESGGNITQQPGAVITVPDLAVNAIGNVSLDAAANQINNVAASLGSSVSHNRNFRFNSAVNLNVAAVDGVSGISTMLDAFGYDPMAPNGLIVLNSGGILSQSVGALLSGKAVYAEGNSVMLNNANPTGAIAGKSHNIVPTDKFVYNTANGLWLTTVNGFSGINAPSAAIPFGVELTAGVAGISQDGNAGIVTPAAVLLNTNGSVNLFSSNNNMAALATAGAAAALHVQNNGNLLLGGGGYGVSTNNQPASFLVNGNLTIDQTVSTGTADLLLHAQNITLGKTQGAVITGKNINLRANQSGTGQINTATASSTINADDLMLEADNINYGSFPPVINAISLVSYGNVTKGNDISVATFANATHNSPWLVVGNQDAVSSNTTDDILLDAPLNRAGQGLALFTGGEVIQSAPVVAQKMVLLAGTVDGVAANAQLLANNQIDQFAAEMNGGILALNNNSTLNVTTLSEGTHSMTGIVNPGGTVKLTVNSGQLNVGSLIDSGAGTIKMSADNMALNAAIKANNVDIAPSSASQSVVLGAADAIGWLGLDNTELGQISAQKLRLTSPGNIQINGLAQLPNVNLLRLESAGGLTQAAGAALTVPYLAVQAAGDVGLDMAGNNVNNLAAIVGNASSPNRHFRFNNVGNLMLDQLDGISGITVAIDGIGYDPVNPNGVVALRSMGFLSQMAGAQLAAKAVYAEGGSVLLTEPNPTGVLAGKVNGNGVSDQFNYASSNGIWLTTVNGVSGIQSSGPVRLASVTGGIKQDANAGVTTAKSLLLSSGGPVTMTGNNNVAQLATEMTAASLNFNNLANLIIGVGGNGLAVNQGNINVNNSGTLQVNRAINAGTGNVGMTANNLTLAAPINAANVNLVSSVGAILDADNESGGPVINVTAGTANLKAQLDIGAQANPVEIKAGSFTATSVAGSVFTDPLPPSPVAPPLSPAQEQVVVETLVNDVYAMAQSNDTFAAQSLNNILEPLFNQNGSTVSGEEEDKDKKASVTTEQTVEQKVQVAPQENALPICR